MSPVLRAPQNAENPRLSRRAYISGAFRELEVRYTPTVTVSSYFPTQKESILSYGESSLFLICITIINSKDGFSVIYLREVTHTRIGIKKIGGISNGSRN
jgi:hypothetical protein